MVENAEAQVDLVVDLEVPAVEATVVGSKVDTEATVAQKDLGAVGVEAVFLLF
jgi:hypothetical protein